MAWPKWLRSLGKLLSVLGTAYFVVTVGGTAIVSGVLLVTHAQPGWFLVGFGAVLLGVFLMAVILGPRLATRLATNQRELVSGPAGSDPTGDTLVRDAGSGDVGASSHWATETGSLTLAEVALLRRLAIINRMVHAGAVRSNQCEFVLSTAGGQTPTKSISRLEARGLLQPGLTDGHFLTPRGAQVAEAFSETLRHDQVLGANYHRVTLAINKQVRFDGKPLVRDDVRPLPSIAVP